MNLAVEAMTGDMAGQSGRTLVFLHPGMLNRAMTGFPKKGQVPVRICTGRLTGLPVTYLYTDGQNYTLRYKLVTAFRVTSAPGYVYPPLMM
jgi:hypothetical protein